MKRLQAEFESKPDVGLTKTNPAGVKAGRKDHKRLEKEETSTAEVSEKLSEDLPPQGYLMEEDSKREEPSVQTEEKECGSKYQILVICPKGRIVRWCLHCRRSSWQSPIKRRR